MNDWRYWVILGLLIVIAVCVVWRDYDHGKQVTDLVAELDELAGEYHTPADRVAALEEYVDHMAQIVTALEQQRLATGRHAHTGSTAAAA